MKTKPTIWTVLIAGILFSFLVLSISCKKQDNPEPKPIVFTDSGSIDSKGGIIKTSDGASVDIPAKALITNQTISITKSTKGEVSINGGYRIYELKPDGLTFSDSVIITLPFDDTYINLNNKEKNYGVGIAVYQDSVWVALKTYIDIKNKIASAKTTHFSTYVIYYPTQWISYYNANKNSAAQILNVPYYNQGSTQWCSFYSLSMISKYAGYYNKGPFWAVNCGATSTSQGIRSIDTDKIGLALTNLGIVNDLCSIGWVNGEELCGYLIDQLNKGFPVWVGSSDIEHAIVVTGHSPTGLYINDPSGYFLNMFIPNLSKTNFANAFTTYESFLGLLFPSYPLTFPFKTNMATTVVIKSSISNNNLATLNFPLGEFSLYITNVSGGNVGDLDINTKYQQNGYSLNNLNSNDNSFNGSDFVNINPVISNSDLNNIVKAKLHFLIDFKDVTGSPLIIDIPKGNSWDDEKSLKFQLSNLSKGNHTLEVELRSFDDPSIKYDYWEFPFKIANEFIDETITDIDGNSYKTVKIGTQTWMAENLKTTKYRNGDKIEPVTDPAVWNAKTTQAYCWYNNDISNKIIYGALYNWYAVADSRNIAPTGWHVASDAEWRTLITYLGGENIAGGKLKETGLNHWLNPNIGATNSSGFTALPGGWCNYDGSFLKVGNIGYWWSSTAFDALNAWGWNILNNYTAVLSLNGATKKYGFSVRCVKD